MKIMAQRVAYKDTIDVFMGGETSSGMIEIWRVEKRLENPGYYIGEPTFELAQTEAQRLMDELWNVGLRPSEGTGSAGSLAATEKHLNSMTKIAYGLLEKNGVKLS